jgi:DNA sulfur modification protein DndC
MTPTLLGTTPRMQMDESIRLTIDSLREYGERYQDWCIAWSGGKDSTATLTVIVWLIRSGRVPSPKTLTVLYADTRQEILPLAFVASEIMDELRELGIELRIVMAPLDKRMWVYILGRGVPPPNNNTLRYCTRQIKVEPMAEVVKVIAAERGSKVLMLTGVRQGESAVRDGRIALSCSRDGGECGQGWFQVSLPEHACDTLAPLLHWRVCHVWEWLRTWAPTAEYGDWSTKLLADAYGGEEAEEINARTGCVCCPLASRDSALDAVIAMSRWAYLAPLKRIREIYRWLREPAQRLRKPGGERRKDGSLCDNQNRMGPIHLAARLEALERLISLQDEVNSEADRLGRPRVDHLNAQEEARIRELVAAEQWPDGWRGDEPRADEPFEEWHRDGSIQRTLLTCEVTNV